MNLGYRFRDVAIYSCSWGASDSSLSVEGPEEKTQKALANGVRFGRRGLGNIFIFPSGNGGDIGDTCACDGFANSIYTFTITSISSKNTKPSYTEQCGAILASTYSGGDSDDEIGIYTTDYDNGCTFMSGTSPSVAIASGILALVLESNPSLTWRDAMHLIVLTSRSDVIKSIDFVKNKRGLMVSSCFGYGIMDAGKMVELAKTWHLVPSLKSCIVNMNA